jgi:hypothetical protein
MPPDDVPCELELIQPVQSVSGATLYNRVTRQTCPGAVDAEGQPVKFGATPLVVDVDAAGNQQRTRVRGDGGDRHLIRRMLPAITEAPLGYYVTEAVPATTRHRFVRDADGHLVAAEVEHGPPRKQQTGFGIA